MIESIVAAVLLVIVVGTGYMLRAIRGPKGVLFECIPACLFFLPAELGLSQVGPLGSGAALWLAGAWVLVRLARRGSSPFPGTFADDLPLFVVGLWAVALVSQPVGSLGSVAPAAPALGVWLALQRKSFARWIAVLSPVACAAFSVLAL